MVQTTFISDFSAISRISAASRPSSIGHGSTKVRTPCSVRNWIRRRTASLTKRGAVEGCCGIEFGARKGNEQMLVHQGAAELI